MGKLTRIAAGLATLLIAGIAPSGALAVTIDFSNASDWIAGQGANSYTYNGTAVGDLTLSTEPSTTTLYFQDGLGVGVECHSIDCEWWNQAESVDAGEYLTVQFDDGPQFLNSLTVSGFYVFEFGKVMGEDFAQIFIGDWDGEKTVYIGEDAGWFRLKAYLWSDFSLKSFTVGEPCIDLRPIPEPNAAILFPVGMVIVGYAALRHRSRRNA